MSEEKQAELQRLLDVRAKRADAQYRNEMNDIAALKKLQGENALKFETYHNNCVFRFPCDICGEANQRADVIHLVIDTPDSLADRFQVGFICDLCAEKFAPKELLAKVEQELEKANSELGFERW